MSGLAKAEESARFFRDLGARTCILTMGGDGCLVATPGRDFRLPALEIDVKDTTGCGDAFDSRPDRRLHHGWDVEKSARFATAAGALVATGLGRTRYRQFRRHRAVDEHGAHATAVSDWAPAAPRQNDPSRSPRNAIRPASQRVEARAWL